jgi:phosphoribosylanthranilate isomerase
MFVKICGVTSVADARMVAAAGAQAIGLNFFAGSPRYVETGVALEIIQSLPSFVEPVGLFVDTPIPEIRHIANSLGLRTIQLHGAVTPQTIAELREFSIVPAFPIGEAADATAAIDFVTACHESGRLPSAMLIDAKVEGKHGGTGQTMPWSVARLVVEGSSVPVTLAGGLTAKNVAEAIRTVRPWGVDVASGVEVAPGRKGSYKVNSFIDAVRNIRSS